MGKQGTIGMNSIITHSTEQVSCELDGEVVLLSVENGKYDHMNEIASRIWALTKIPWKVSSLCDHLMNEYLVERARCEEDLISLLNLLCKDKLILVARDEKA